MKLTLSSAEFSHLVICFLYAQLTNPEESVPVALDKEWGEFINVLDRKGMKGILLKYYLGTDPQIRIRWNMIRKTFMDVAGSNPSYIEIRNQKMPVKEKGPSILKTAGNLLKNIVKAGVSGAMG
jgi:hypothetical protein